MIIKNEDWDRVANYRKQNLGCCELCGYRPADSTELRARHLQYGRDVDDKYMLILCQDHNYQFGKAEQFEIAQLNNLNCQTYDMYIHIITDQYYEGSKITDIMRLLSDYMRQRSNIIADAIVAAIGLCRTHKRPMIDMLYRHPNSEYDRDLRYLCKEYGVWDATLDSRLAKAKFDALRQSAKDAQKTTKK